jgi:hypothetical protein
MQKKIFISSSSKDRKAALTICAAIEGRGYACWISSRDVGPGENFQEAIVRAIRNAGLMVLVFSANANNSDEIKKEVALAGQNRLAVLPVRIEDVVPSEAFSYELATRQWIDVFDDWERDMQQLLAHIANILPAIDNAPSSAPRAALAPEAKDAKKNKNAYWAAGSALAVILLAAGWWMAMKSPGGMASRSPAPVQSPRNPAPAKSLSQAPSRQPHVTDPAQLELAYWQSIKDSQDPADFRAYLQQYPHGTFQALAQARLARETAPKRFNQSQAAVQHKDTEMPAAAKTIAAADAGAAASGTPATSPVPAAAANAEASAAGKFDGRWMVTIACPRSSDGAMPYSYDFSADVKNAVFHGERNATGQAGGALVLDGHIGADGGAQLEARGVVGKTGYAVNGLSQGASFTHPVTAHFDAAQGSGSWVANRICSFSFRKM